MCLVELQFQISREKLETTGIRILGLQVFSLALYYLSYRGLISGTMFSRLK